MTKKHSIEFTDYEVAYLYGFLRGMRKHMLPETVDTLDQIISRLQIVYHELKNRENV
jgi:hypothetical protein